MAGGVAGSGVRGSRFAYTRTMKRIPLVALLLLSAVLIPSRASADITAFFGVNPTPVNRPVRGFSVGAGLLIVGFEFEYANTSDDDEQVAPQLQTYMGNGLVQTPIPIAGMQFYATAGGGVYRETLFDEFSETHVGYNVGGGIKMSLAGPLRLRFDYRVFTLQGEPRHREAAAVLRGVEPEVLREEDEGQAPSGAVALLRLGY